MCRNLFIGILNVIMLSVVMLSVVMLSVFMLSVVMLSCGACDFGPRILKLRVVILSLIGFGLKEHLKSCSITIYSMTNT